MHVTALSMDGMCIMTNIKYRDGYLHRCSHMACPNNCFKGKTTFTLHGCPTDRRIYNCLSCKATWTEDVSNAECDPNPLKFNMNAFCSAVANGAVPNLEILSITHIPIGDISAIHLANACSSSLFKLKELCLGGCNIGDVGFSGLLPMASSKELRSFSFGNNNIGDIGIKALIKAADAGHIKKLQCLALNDNNISKFGKSSLLKTIAMKKLPGLKCLYLDKYCIFLREGRMIY